MAHNGSKRRLSPLHVIQNNFYLAKAYKKYFKQFVLGGCFHGKNCKKTFLKSGYVQPLPIWGQGGLGQIFLNFLLAPYPDFQNQKNLGLEVFKQKSY